MIKSLSDMTFSVAWVVAVLWTIWMPSAAAQVALESVDNAVIVNSGPTTNGPNANAQVVTLRHNTDNPGGNTMAARTPAITATFSFTNQQFSGLTPAQGYPASTGGFATFFGGGATTTGNAPASGPLYSSMNVGTASANQFTSISPATTGTGIDLTANGGIRLFLSTGGIVAQAPATPTNSRVRMADLVISFSTPVNNPILHFAGNGGRVSSDGVTPQLGISGEFEVLTSGVTLTRLSGNPVFVLSGNNINNLGPELGASCATTSGPRGACGSVQVNGTGLSSVTLRVFLRGDGTAGGNWTGNPTSFNADGLVVGVSVIEPTPTVTVRKVTTGGVGTFNFTGTNGYTATAVTTATAGTPVDGTTRTLTAAGVSTTLTEALTAGYRLTGISCTGLGTGGVATVGALPAAGVAGGGTVTLNAAATALGSNIVCTFTNEKLPILRLQKTLPNGRVAEGNQFTLSIAGIGAPAAVTTTGTGTTAAGSVSHASAAVGSNYTLSETAAGSPATVLANYSTSYSCTNARSNGQALSGSGGTSFIVTTEPGDDLTCTFFNARNIADLAISKSSNVVSVVAGDTITYSIVVTNNGPMATSNAVVRDDWTTQPGLDCSTGTATCAVSGTGGTQCPAPASVTPAQLQSGLAVPLLPNGGVVTFSLTCSVTATGQ
nr:hypothetical protein [uncultured Pseudoxanthomonas sp.]